MIHPIEPLLAHLAEVFDDEESARLERELQDINDVPTLLLLAEKYDDDLTAGPVLRRALQLEPESEPALEKLGEVLVRYHIVDEADTVLEKLRHLYPKNARGFDLTLQLNGPAQYLLGMENWARKLRALEPKNQRGVRYLAKILAIPDYYCCSDVGGWSE